MATEALKERGRDVGCGCCGQIPPARLSQPTSLRLPTRPAVAVTVLLAFASFGLPRRLEAQQVHACFAPEHHGGQTCTDQVVSAIAGAHQLILVQAYGFTSAPIAKALTDAHKRGIDVRVILDKSNLKEGYSSAAFLEHMGITPLIDSNHAIAHNKVMVIDAREVITGSFNFTKAAEEKNAENVVFIDDPATAAEFAQNWKDHAAHSAAANSVEHRASSARYYAAARSDLVSGVTGNRKSHIYRWPGCPTTGTIAPQNRVEFPNAQAAQAAGYRPARDCP
jgi:phosphatidylserine/phosphatidylglycerophosphate/cardiolipin synthase-like enzyme